MEAPPGYDIPKGYTLHLKKALYGLKQAGWQWYKMLQDKLKAFRLTQITNDLHTFVVHQMFNGKCHTLILPIYVDDLLPMGDKVLVDNFEAFLPDSFEVSAAGDTNFFLGLRIQWIRGKSLRVDQHAFIDVILKCFHIPESSSIRTPLSLSGKLIPNTAPIEDTEVTCWQAYQSMIRSLMYLMLGTRPNLAYSIRKLACFSSNPSDNHIHTLQRVFLYVCNTLHLYLEWFWNGDFHPCGLVDADFAGDISDRKSTAGYFFSFAGTVFAWSSKKEHTVATSTMEAKYIAIYMASQQAAWIYQFYSQISFELEKPIPIYSDSQTALNVTTTKQAHKLSKHLDIKLHSMRECIKCKQIKLIWIKTKNNQADILTKSLPADLFKKHIKSIGLEQTSHLNLEDEQAVERELADLELKNKREC